MQTFASSASPTFHAEGDAGFQHLRIRPLFSAPTLLVSAKAAVLHLMARPSTTVSGRLGSGTISANGAFTVSVTEPGVRYDRTPSLKFWKTPTSMSPRHRMVGLRWHVDDHTRRRYGEGYGAVFAPSLGT
jgi:hypothetical protein